MDPYLFLCTLGLISSVINGQMVQSQLGQMGQRRNFPPRQPGGGGMMPGGNGQVVSMNTGTPGNNGQGPGMQGQSNPMHGQGMNGGGGGGGGSMGQGMGNGGQGNNGMGNGGGMGQGGMGGNGGFGMMGGGGIDPSAFMGGGGGNANWMRMNMAMNSEIPPHMMMGRNFNPRNFMQYRACEKTPSNFNHICNPQAPNQCQTGSMLSASMPMMGGMMGAMGGAGGGAGQQNPLVCSRMTEHGIARCCARNLQLARYLDKMFR